MIALNAKNGRKVGEGMDKEKVIKAYECCKNSYDRRCDKCPYEKDCCHDGLPMFVIKKMVALLKEQKAQDVMDIRDIDGLWCDDITFCQEECGWKSCPRNKKNIRDRTVPHSFSVEIPEDCPKRQECR